MGTAKKANDLITHLEEKFKEFLRTYKDEFWDTINFDEIKSEPKLSDSDIDWVSVNLDLNIDEFMYEGLMKRIK